MDWIKDTEFLPARARHDQQQGCLDDLQRLTMLVGCLHTHMYQKQFGCIKKTELDFNRAVAAMWSFMTMTAIVSPIPAE